MDRFKVSKRAGSRNVTLLTSPKNPVSHYFIQSAEAPMLSLLRRRPSSSTRASFFLPQQSAPQRHHHRHPRGPLIIRCVGSSPKKKMPGRTTQQRTMSPRGIVAREGGARRHPRKRVGPRDNKASSSSSSSSVVLEPTDRELRVVAMHQAVPFVGFGIMDNSILILAGEAIDINLGATLGISTMCAAAIGNIGADLVRAARGWDGRIPRALLAARPPLNEIKHRHTHASSFFFRSPSSLLLTPPLPYPYQRTVRSRLRYRFRDVDREGVERTTDIAPRAATHVRTAQSTEREGRRAVRVRGGSHSRLFDRDVPPPVLFGG